MAELGKKFECYNCRTKFYNLNKPDPICPKCGANQKNAKSDDSPPPVPRPPRRSILMEPIPEDNAGEFGEEPAEDAADGDDDDLDETEELGETAPAVEEEEEF
jgi:hypothetical protein